MFPRRILAILTGVHIALVCVVTLTPVPADTANTSAFVRTILDFFAAHGVTAWVDFTVLEFAANIVMFVPFGLLVALLSGSRRWWWGVVCGAAFTLFIEAAQGAFLPTRVASASDLIANTAGAAIGAAAALFALHINERGSQKSLRMADRAISSV